MRKVLYHKGNDVLFDTLQAAEYLTLKEATLEAWRCRKQGPKYIKLGRTVRYKKDDLDSYINNNLQEGEV